jgi:hypothetical protein
MSDSHTAAGWAVLATRRRRESVRAYAPADGPNHRALRHGRDSVSKRALHACRPATTLTALDHPCKNAGMKIKEDLPSSDEAADAQAVIEHALTGQPLDPEIARRVRERSERATEALWRKSGTLNIAVDLIREVRDRE